MAAAFANPVKPVLVLDLDETLVNSRECLWKRADFEICNGKFKVQMRPHCREFLRELKPFYQLVIFTAGSPAYMEAIKDHLDPDGDLFTAAFASDHLTWLPLGSYVKDLRIVEEELKVPSYSVAILDNTPNAYAWHQHSGCPILDFMCESDDNELVAYKKFFLEHANKPNLSRVVQLCKEMFNKRARGNWLRWHAGKPIYSFPLNEGTVLGPPDPGPTLFSRSLKRRRLFAPSGVVKVDDDGRPLKRRRICGPSGVVKVDDNGLGSYYTAINGVTVRRSRRIAAQRS